MSDKLQGGIEAGSKNVSLSVLIRKTADGTERTGLTFESSGLKMYYIRQGGSPTTVAPATLAAIDSAHSDGGFKEADATNMPGLYRTDWPDAAFEVGADFVNIAVGGTTGDYWYQERIPLTSKLRSNSIYTG